MPRKACVAALGFLIFYKVALSTSVTMSNTPIAFTKNNGQWPDKVLYRASTGDATMWFTDTRVLYQLTKRIPRGEIAFGETPPKGTPADKFGKLPDSVECIKIEAKFLGAKLNANVTGLTEIAYKCNYFLGDDPKKWRTDVPNYEAIQYEEIYSGIDLKYYGNNGQMEYDFIVSPGADYGQIQIRYNGAQSLSLGEQGELRIKTEYGEIIEQPLFVYQDINGARAELKGRYVIGENSTFRFEVDEYNSAYALVIDPVLIYSTYLGGSGVDEILGIAVNSAGEAIVAGYTQSANFPMVNAYQSTIVFFDAFVTKFSSSGSSVIFSTYLGGTGEDLAYVADVDGSGDIYLAGQTSSTDFPTLNEYQTEQGDYDVFVTKMSSAGNSLSYSTHIGGSVDESAYALAVDTSGAAYVTGYTNSTNYPNVNSFQTDQVGLDAFVTKVSPTGSSLVYSTYLGQSGIDQGNGIAVDAAGSAYVVGLTTSTSFPTMNAFQTDQPQGDAFATKFSADGSSLVYSTYLGGGGGEQAYGVFVDNAGVAYIAGSTSSTNFPTLTPYQTDQPVTDAFVLKLSSAGTNLFFSTYLGGDGNDVAYGICVDSLGYVSVSGSTASTNFPTQSSYQADAGTTDVFVTKFNPSGTGLVYSTYLGGDSLDVSRGLTLDGSGAAYITGYTRSPNFPTLNPYQVNQGIIDVFVAKLRFCCIVNRGDCNNDGVDANILDLTFVVDRIFRGGPPAVCPEEADVNSDGATSNILDLTFLVDRIFRAGPAPGPC